MNDPYGVVYETANLGLAEYLMGAPDAAAALFAESFDLASQVRMKASIAYALIGLAMAGSDGTRAGPPGCMERPIGPGRPGRDRRFRGGRAA